MRRRVVGDGGGWRTGVEGGEVVDCGFAMLCVAGVADGRGWFGMV